ncbi:MAG: hypothetical protein R3D02_13310 [Hyphomicrobiales bacterium]
MNESDKDRERRRTALRDIERAVEQSETIAGSTIGRMADNARRHLAAEDADPDDAIEVWGRRVGRTIGLIVFVVLAVYLVLTLSARWSG